MTVWVKGDCAQAYISISGDATGEQIEYLRVKLLDCVQYGYRRIVVDVNDVRSFDSRGVDMLKYVHRRLSNSGGNLIIEDKNGVVEKLSGV